MTKYPLLILFLVLTFSVSGQNLQLINRIKADLRTAQQEKRFHLLNDLAWEYRMAYPDSTIVYANQAISLGNQLQLPKGLAKPVNFIGIAKNYKGDRIGSYEQYDEALAIATRQYDSVQIAHSNNNLGRLFFEQGLLSRSYEYFVKALAIFEAINDSSGLAYTYQSLANLYKSQGDYRKAEINYYKAYRIRLILGNSRDIMSAMVQMARLYQDNDQREKALQYLLLADSTGQVIHDEINLAEIKTFLAENYLYQQMLEKAEAACTEGLVVIERLNNTRMMPHAYITLGKIRLHKRDLASAKKWFNLALSIANRTKDLSSKMDCHYWLWKLSEQEKNTLEQLRNHNLYLMLKDSVKDLDVTRQVERLQFEIEIQRKEQENELLKANEARNNAIIQQQKLQNIMLIGIIGFGSVLGFIQWRSNKKSSIINLKLAQQNQYIQEQRQEIIHQNEKLSKRNQQLSDINHEKDTLMGIVAHDLKSPLNRIKGIMDIMELEGGLTENHKMYVGLTKDATRAGLDLIKDLLDVHMLEENVEPNYSSFDISQFLLEKTKAFEPVAETKNIHLLISRVENEEVFLDRDYLNRIVDNLISNAIKFSGSESVINVAAGKTNGHVWISVKDQGPGFSENDKNLLFQKFKKLSARPTAGETSNGLGLAIVKTLVDRLNGSIDLISEPKKGSEFIVKFPADKA